VTVSRGFSFYKIRLNHSNDKAADAIAITAAATASRLEISTSFFCTIMRELSFS
jgi:hypothetical protein